MPDVFRPLFPDEIALSAPDAQGLLDSHAAQKKTGWIRLSYPLEKRLHFLFKRGKLANAYLVAPERWEPFTYENSLSWIRAAGEATVKAVPLSPAGLRVVKMTIETQNPAEAVFLARGEVEKKIRELKAKGEDLFARLEWKEAAGMVLFQAEEDAHFTFFSPEIILDEAGSCGALCEWDEPECALTLYEPDLESGVWQEYYLRRAFQKICERSLARFETLAGQALVDSLARLINLSASRQGLEISIARGKLTDAELFSSPQQALYNYRLLLSKMFEHFASIIGSRLYVATLRDAALNLPPNELAAVRKLELLSKGYLNE